MCIFYDREKKRENICTMQDSIMKDLKYFVVNISIPLFFFSSIKVNPLNPPMRVRVKKKYVNLIV